MFGWSVSGDQNSTPGQHQVILNCSNSDLDPCRNTCNAVGLRLNGHPCVQIGDTVVYTYSILQIQSCYKVHILHGLGMKDRGMLPEFDAKYATH